jgi:DNA-binding XRE family transcriptional regulator
VQRTYPIGYYRRMVGLLGWVRRAAGLTQQEWARLAGTSRPTVSAYEHGRKSPTLETAERLVAAAGYRLVAERAPVYRSVVSGRGRPVVVPSVLPRLDVSRAFATVELPLHLEWSTPGRRVDLSDRRQRARVYEVVLREGGPDDIAGYVDGALLVDLWPELVLPAFVRRAWEPVVAAAMGTAAA